MSRAVGVAVGVAGGGPGPAAGLATRRTPWQPAAMLEMGQRCTPVWIPRRLHRHSPAMPPMRRAHAPRTRGLSAPLLATLLLASPPSPLSPWAAGDAYAAGAAAASAPPSWWPKAWLAGAALDGTTVVETVGHAEFVRVKTARGGGFEVVACPETPDAWCRGALRLQPLPGATIDESWLQARLPELAAVDPEARLAPPRRQGGPTPSEAAAVTVPGREGAAQGPAPASGPAEGAAEAHAAPPAEAPPWARALAAFALPLALLLGLGVGWRLTREAPHLRRYVQLSAGWCVLAPLLGRVLLGPQSVDLAHVNLLHEGWTLEMARALTDPWPTGSPTWLLLGPGEGIAGKVAANRLLYALDALLLMALLEGDGHSRKRALALAALALLAPAAWATMHSETDVPAMLLRWLLGAVGLCAARNAALGRPWRFVGLGLIAALTLGIERRQEYYGLAAAALVWGGGALALPEAMRAHITSSLGRVFAGALALPALLLAILLWLGSGIRVSGTRFEVGGLLAAPPIWPAWLRAPLDLGDTAPVLLVGLVCLGAVAIAARPGERRLLPLLAIACGQYNLYLRVGHADAMELQRYLVNLTPALALIAGAGWRWLDALTDSWRAEQPQRARARAMTLGLWVCAVVDGRIGDSDHPYGPALLRSPLQNDVQVEARLVARHLEAAPDCVFVMRGATELRSRCTPGPSELVVLGMGIGGPRRSADDPAALRATLDRLDRRPGCLRTVQGVDCALAGMPDCTGLGEGAPLETIVMRSRPYRADHFGCNDRAMLTLQVRPLAPALSGQASARP